MNSILDFRNAVGLGQNDLAEWLSISRSLLSLVELERKSLPTPALIRLSKLKLALKDLEEKGPLEFEPLEPITFPKEVPAIHRKIEKLLLELQGLELEIKILEENMGKWKKALALCQALKKEDWLQAEHRILEAIARFEEKSWILWCERGPRQLEWLRFYQRQKVEEKVFLLAWVKNLIP